jgi:hypothetical protein
MKMKLIISIIAGTAFALGSVFAEAEGDKKKRPEGAKGKGGDPAKMFEKVDSNADGSISESEWMAGPGKRATDAGKGDQAKAAFGKMAGEDAMLTLEEFTKAREARAKKGGDKKGKGGDKKGKGGDKKKKDDA